MTAQKRRAVIMGCAVMGVLLILLSAVLILYDRFRTDFAAKKAASLVETLCSVMPDSTDGIFDENADSGMGMSIFVVDGAGYVGVLCAPSLNLQLPVAEEWTDDLPMRYAGNAAAGSLQITGNMDGFENLTIGDTIVFRDMRGQRWNYSVYDMVRGEYEPNDVRTETMLVLQFAHYHTTITVMCKSCAVYGNY